MIKYIYSFFLIMALTGLYHTLVFGQATSSDSGDKPRTVQPKIMVIPFTKEGEDIRTVLEGDINKRIAITKIKEAFDNRGFTTVDFTARLKAAIDNRIFQSDNQTDIKLQLVQMSGADIYVDAEVEINRFPNGDNRVTVLLTAYEVSTGNSLSNKTGRSPISRSADFGLLAEQAVKPIVEEFLNTMQSKFDDIVENGQAIAVEFTFDPASEHTMFSEVGSDGDLLFLAIEDWMGRNAYKNYYHSSGGYTELGYLFDEVRIPLKDPKTGMNYNATRFSGEIIRFLRDLKIQSAPARRGNTILITIK